MHQTLTFSPSHSPAGATGSDRTPPFPGRKLRNLHVRCVMAPAEESLYEVLRVKRDASSREIKSAYRTLAKIYHPDAASAADSVEQSSPDGRLFIEIRNAYATLSDPAARSLYDLQLSAGAGRSPIGFRACRYGSYPTRRWETDQCW